MSTKTEDLDFTEDRLFSLGWGLVYQAVCAPADWDAERVAADKTANDPPGTSVNRWVITDVSDQDHEAFPQNPMPCDQCDGRKHWLLNC